MGPRARTRPRSSYPCSWSTCHGKSPRPCVAHRNYRLRLRVTWTRNRERGFYVPFVSKSIAIVHRAPLHECTTSCATGQIGVTRSGNWKGSRPGHCKQGSFVCVNWKNRAASRFLIIAFSVLRDRLLSIYRSSFGVPVCYHGEGRRCN